MCGLGSPGSSAAAELSHWLGTAWEESGLDVNAGTDLKYTAAKGGLLATFLAASSLLKDLRVGLP